MNKTRRKKLQTAYVALLDLSALIEEVKGEEEEVLYSIPERLQGTEQYEQCKSLISALEEAQECIESARDELNMGISEIHEKEPQSTAMLGGRRKTNQG